jgi:hypothetical protein
MPKDAKEVPRVPRKRPFFSENTQNPEKMLDNFRHFAGIFDVPIVPKVILAYSA